MNGQQLQETCSCRGLSVFACRRLIQLCKISKMNVTHLVSPCRWRRRRVVSLWLWATCALVEASSTSRAKASSRPTLCTQRWPAHCPKGTSCRKIGSLNADNTQAQSTDIHFWLMKKVSSSQCCCSRKKVWGTKETDLRHEEETLDFNFASQVNLCHSCSIHFVTYVTVSVACTASRQ